MSDDNAPDGNTVFIVDAEAAACDALAAALRAAGRGVETFDSAEAFLESRAESRPGCLVVDARLPGMSGLELQDWLLERRCALPIVVVSGSTDVRMVVRAIKRGAFDFLEKPIDASQLLAAIDGATAAVARGPSLPPAIESLTRREREVLDLILAGRQTRAISEALFISIKTVEFHRSRIHAKLKVSSMAELFRLFLGHAKSLEVTK
jgi:FixJ family two-component response regulator